jgi:hypothetical protein
LCLCSVRPLFLLLDYTILVALSFAFTVAVGVNLRRAHFGFGAIGALRLFLDHSVALAFPLTLLFAVSGTTASALAMTLASTLTIRLRRHVRARI